MQVKNNAGHDSSNPGYSITTTGDDTVGALIKAPLKNIYGSLGARSLERKKFLSTLTGALFREAPCN